MEHLRTKTGFTHILLLFIVSYSVTGRDVCETTEFGEYYCEDWSYCCGDLCCDMTKWIITGMVIGGILGLGILGAICYGFVYSIVMIVRKLSNLRVTPQNNYNDETRTRNVPISTLSNTGV